MSRRRQTTDDDEDLVGLNEQKAREEATADLESRFNQISHHFNLINARLDRVDSGLTSLGRLENLLANLNLAQAVKKEPESTAAVTTPAPLSNHPEKRKLFTTAGTTRRIPPPPPLSDTDVLALIKEKFSKEAIVRAANSTVVLQHSNGEIFISRFMDYMETMGLKQALMATRVQCIDPETNKATEEASNQRIHALRTHSKAPWAEAHVQLKSLLTPDMYEELVINKDKDGKQDFFDLWNLCLQKTGNKRTCDTMMMKRDQFDKLKLNKGVFLSTFLSNLEALADDVNRLGGSLHITNFERNRKLYNEAKKYKRFNNICDLVLPEIDTATWKAFSQRFDPYKPKGKHGEEVALGEPDGDNEEGEDRTEMANAATNDLGAGNRTRVTNRTPKECTFCKRKGHTVDECRSKKYNGYSVPNRNCRQWVMNGRCTWEQETGKQCKFEHNQLTRNQKNWEANLKRSEQKAIDSSNLATTADDTEEQSANGVTTDVDGIIELVDGIPSGWTHHIHHNPFGVLTEEEEQENQQQLTKKKEATEQENQRPVTEEKKEKESTVKPAPETGIEPVTASKIKSSKLTTVCVWLLSLFTALWPSHLISCSVKTRRKKRTVNKAQALHATDKQKSATVILDSGCSKSNHPTQQGLQKITTKLVRMFTATNSSTLSTKEGTLMIEGLPVRVSVVPTFDKTLVSLGELDKMGITWTGGNRKWELYHQDGTLWTTLQLGKDNLYHFTAAEHQQQP